MDEALAYCSNCGISLSVAEYLDAGIIPLCDDCKEVVDIPTCKLCGGHLMYTGTLGMRRGNLNFCTNSLSPSYHLKANRQQTTIR